MLPYGPIWSEMVQNCPKWSLIVQDNIKWSNGQKISNLSKNCPKCFKMVQNGQQFSKWSIIVRYRPKEFKTVQFFFKCPHIFQNGPIKSKFFLNDFKKLPQLV